MLMCLLCKTFSDEMKSGQLLILKERNPDFCRDNDLFGPTGYQESLGRKNLKVN
jgi:hypothetical protein